jgi:uncharacterized membrane protein YphA (DoxX/SURF4 family)
MAMHVALWIAQGIVAVIFIYSGVNKMLRSERELVKMGQTGVEGLSIPTIRFIATCELLGALGMIFPTWLTIAPLLTPLTAIMLGVVMILAANIHYKRGESQNVINNMIILALCIFIAAGRLSGIYID